MRYALSDSEWGAIQPILPAKPRGVLRVDGRPFVLGTLATEFLMWFWQDLALYIPYKL